MRVDVVLTPMDFKAFTKAAYHRAKALPRPDSNPSRRRLARAAVWLVLVLLSVVANRLLGGRILDYLPLGALMGLSFCGLFVYLLFDAQRRLSPDASGVILGSRSYELTDEGVVETSLHQESRTRWSGVKAVVDTPGYIFLFVDRCAAMIVPKRLFSTPDDAVQFRAFAEQRVNSAEFAATGSIKSEP